MSAYKIVTFYFAYLLNPITVQYIVGCVAADGSANIYEYVTSQITL